MCRFSERSRVHRFLRHEHIDMPDLWAPWPLGRVFSQDGHINSALVFMIAFLGIGTATSLCQVGNAHGRRDTRDTWHMRRLDRARTDGPRHGFAGWLPLILIPGPYRRHIFVETLN